MKRLLIAILSAAGLGMAIAQQMDHSSMPMPGPTAKPSANSSRPPSAKPGAAHDMKSMRAPKASAKPKAGHDMGTMADPAKRAPPTPPPAIALSGPRHAADTVFDPRVMAGARDQLRSEQGDVKAYLVLVDRLETQYQRGRNGYRWDMQGWYGGDIDKLWFKSEGGGLYRGKLETGEVQALWSRAIEPFFDLQAGVRHDFAPTPTRTHFALGVQGLMPYMYNLEAALFVSTKGELTARLKAEYDQRITQRLIIQPSAEINLAAEDMPDIGIGAGLSTFETGLRLRYEFVPEFAPYIGIEYERKVGNTADFARAKGEDVGGLRYVAGLRAWF